MVRTTEHKAIPEKRHAPFASGFLNTLVLRWRTLFRYGMAGALLLFAFSFLRPHIYSATTTVLPPEKQGVGGMMALLASSSALDILKGEAASNPALEQFKTVIDSRSVAEEVAKDPRIHAWFSKQDTSTKHITDAVLGSLTSEALRIGMMTVSTQVAAPLFASRVQLDSARNMAAYLANKYVEELDRFNRDRLLTSAHATRVFVEGEYRTRLAQLDTAYLRLEQFQEGHQAIALPEQLSATVSAAAKLTGRIQELEMQRNVEERELGEGSPRLKTLDAGIDAAKDQLRKYDDGGVGDYVLALKNVPALSRELASLLRETKVLEQVSAFLRQELEQDRINEQRDLPSLQVLDSAQPQSERTSPNRLMHASIGLILGFLIGLFLVFTRGYAADVRENPESHYRFLNFIRTARNGNRAQLLKPMVPQTSGASNGNSAVRVTERM
jgi:tyrosine-protein kinase Etk/Wzc